MDHLLKFEWNPTDLLLQTIFEEKSLPLGVLVSQEGSAHLEAFSQDLSLWAVFINLWLSENGYH